MLLILLQSPLQPPAYLDAGSKPHEHGLSIEEPPLCTRCIVQPESVEKLEQHSKVMKLPKGIVQPPERLTQGSSGRVWLDNPFLPDANGWDNDSLKTTNVLRRPPEWMRMLPSNINPDIETPAYSVLNRRRSFPYVESTRLSTPFTTPKEYIPPNRRGKLSLAMPPTIIDKRIADHQKALQSFSRSKSLSYHTTVTKARIPMIPLTLDSTLTSSRLRPAPMSRTEPLSGLTSHSSYAKKPQAKLRKRRSRTSQRHSESATSSRRSSSNNNTRYSDRKTHTPIPTQDTNPAKPPFLKELSGFFANRSGKWILPSRVSEGNERPTNISFKKNRCNDCGNEIRVARHVVGEQMSCDDCLMAAGMPGSWS